MEESKATALWLDSQDHAEVLRAGGDVQANVERVTAVRPELRVGTRTPQGRVVWATGGLERNSSIDALVREGKLGYQGKWEAFDIDVVARPATLIYSAKHRIDRSAAHVLKFWMIP